MPTTRQQSRRTSRNRPAETANSAHRRQQAQRSHVAHRGIGWMTSKQRHRTTRLYDHTYATKQPTRARPQQTVAGYQTNMPQKWRLEIYRTVQPAAATVAPDSLRRFLFVPQHRRKKRPTATATAPSPMPVDSHAGVPTHICTCLFRGCKPGQTDADCVAGVTHEAVAQDRVQPKLLDVGHLLAGPEEPRHPAKGPAAKERERKAQQNK